MILEITTQQVKAITIFKPRTDDLSEVNSCCKITIQWTDSINVRITKQNKNRLFSNMLILCRHVRHVDQCKSNSPSIVKSLSLTNITQIKYINMFMFYQTSCAPPICFEIIVPIFSPYNVILVL